MLHGVGAAQAESVFEAAQEIAEVHPRILRNRTVGGGREVGEQNLLAATGIGDAEIGQRRLRIRAVAQVDRQVRNRTVIGIGIDADLVVGDVVIGGAEIHAAARPAR
jgi:hypothetical protein